MRLVRLALVALAGLIALPAAAQVIATLPVTCNASGTNCTQATPVVNPDGTTISGGGGGGTPTGTAGSPNAAVVTVQGVSGGTVVPISAAALPLPTGAATETTLAAASGKLPASLGAKTGATSLSVVPASDGFATIAGGNVASGATDSGNPIKIGGVYNSGALSAVTTGQRTNLQSDQYGNARVSLTGIGASTGDTIGAAAGAFVTTSASGAGSGAVLVVGNYVSDGTNWNRSRGDTTGNWVVPTPTAVAGNAITPVVTSVAAGSVVGKASAGNLYGVNVTTGASAGYVLIFNATSAPADGTVTPVKCLPIAANTGVDLNYRSLPVAFSTGITAVFSTTGCFTKTISATAFISIDVK
jgi:hypothetical protein